MIVIGAKGDAKELLEDLVSSKYQYNDSNLFFFDNISTDAPDKLFNKFIILNSLESVKSVFDTGNTDFTIGLGNPKHRKRLVDIFEKLGGNLISIISERATIGSFDNYFGKGVIIRSGVAISNSISIGKGSLVNTKCVISHDSTLGEFVELSPSVSVSGHCSIGNFTSIGIGSTVLPNIKIGSNCIIGAGSVITKNIPNNSVVVGVPGEVIKQNI